MEINATTTAEWLDKMNVRVVDRLNTEKAAQSIDWVSFSGTYDAVNNQIEATYDSGKGSIIRICYFDFRVIHDVIYARAAIEDVKHNNARILLSNTRRHDMIDCKELAERDHVTEKQMYWYFREHAKEASYENNVPVRYKCNSQDWAWTLYKGISRVFDVGEKRQGKVGVSAAETVANAAFKQRIDNTRNTIELLDDTTHKLQAMLAKCDGYFEPAKISYATDRARCYTNPYNKNLFAQIPCEAHVYLNPDRLKYRSAEIKKNFALLITYKLIYDEEFNSVTAGNITYNINEYYFDEVEVDVDDTRELYIGTKLFDGLKQSKVFQYSKVNLEDFETHVIAVAKDRLDKLFEFVKFAQR